MEEMVGSSVLAPLTQIVSGNEKLFEFVCIRKFLLVNNF